jgi:hypothetical protein
MSQIIRIGKPALAPSVRDMFRRLAQREAEEIRRLKLAMSLRSQH